MGTPSSTFSAEIRGHLARTRKTPAELALVLGVSEATIYRRLNENYIWPLDDAMTTAEWFGLPLSALLPTPAREAIA